jgi:hypothetical protein
VSAIDKIMAETLWHIDAQVEEMGWDQDAALFAVLVGEVEEGVGVIELKPAPGWNVCLQYTEDPKKALQALGLILSRTPDSLRKETYPPEHLYGLVFVTEAWMLRAPLGTEPQMPADYEVAARNHTVSTHPDRVETRFLYCVSTRGDVAALNHERDGIVEAFDPDKGNFDGQVPDLLHALIKELTK